MVYSCGLISEFTQVTGAMVKFMESGHICMLTIDFIMENTKMTSVKDMDATSMGMEEPISVNGKMESRMATDIWFYLME